MIAPDRSPPPAQEAAPGIEQPASTPSASVRLRPWPRPEAQPACATLPSCPDMLGRWVWYLRHPCFCYGTGDRVQSGSEMKPVDSGGLACCASPRGLRVRERKVSVPEACSDWDICLTAGRQNEVGCVAPVSASTLDHVPSRSLDGKRSSGGRGRTIGSCAALV